jgi:transglutaminase superfamily protein/coenzyme PQQ synthesis protein D (PqqD)
MIEVEVSGRVHCRDEPHGGVVLLNAATGQWHALNATAGDLWRSWQAGDGFEEGVAAVAGRYPQVPPDRIRDDAELLLNQLVARGLLHVTLPERAEAVTMAGGGPGAELNNPRTRRSLRAVAYCCLLLAVIFTRLPFQSTYRLVHSTRKSWRQTTPTWERASTIVAAVHLAARWYPGRAACLELSLAAVLLAALLCRRLDWCLGAAADPYRFHAWVETGGQPVPGPGNPAEHARYLRVLTV